MVACLAIRGSDVARLGRVIAWEVTQEVAVFAGLDDSHQRLHARIVFAGGGEAQIKTFHSHWQEAESCLGSDQLQTDTGIGPAAANRLGNSTMIARESARGGAFVEQLVKTLPSA